MQTVTTPTLDAIRNNTAVQSAVRCIVEWNQNRYSPITSVTNTVADKDPDIFPINSIVLPSRPVAGIVVARSTDAVRLAGLGAEGLSDDGYRDTATGPRYMAADPDAKYKYWSSPATSSGTGSMTPSTIANCRPQVLYTNPTWANKIVVCFENSIAQPSIYTVEITTDGTNWTTISTTPTIASNGRVELYRQSGGTWTTTVSRDNAIQIRGVRINVTQMNKGGVYCDVIELSARFEVDVSDYVVDWDWTSELSDHSFIAPLGSASSNTGSIKLSNVDGRFTNDNSSSPYYGLMDKYADVRLDIGISVDAYTVTSKTYEWIRAFTGMAETWTGQDRDGTSLDVKDGSMYLQSIKPQPLFYEAMTIGEIIWRILDSVGFTSYAYERIDADSATLVPYYWSDGTKTVWEMIKELTVHTQSAVYFDEFGILQIKTRNTAYNLAKTPVWTLTSVPSAPRLPDIVKLNRTEDFEANVVNVAYQVAKVSDENNGVPIMETIWEPEGDVVLRASPLFASITSTSQSLKINPTHAKSWPFTGVMQIEGEFIRWVSKGYSYYLANGTMTSKYITSEDERKTLDKLNPNLSFKNFYNGYLWCGLANRGIWNSVAKAHNVDSTGWQCRYRTGTGAVTTWSGGFTQQPLTSTAKIKTNSTFKWNTWYVVSRGTAGSAYQRYVSTRMKFSNDSGNPPGAAGIVLSPGPSDSGFFVELFKTSYMTPTAMQTTNELSFYTRSSGGVLKRFGPNGGKGVRLEVVPEKWYDIDVSIAQGGSSTTFVIAVNGIVRMTVVVPSADYPTEGNNGRYGMFSRGFINVDYEYFAGSTNAEYSMPDEPGEFDRLTGGYQSNQLISEFGYRTRVTTQYYPRLNSTSPSTSIRDVYTAMAYDEFGAICHEVREYDVQFSKSPVLHSRLYFSNESQILCPQYVSDAFSAQFILGNKYRTNAVVNGEDLVSFGANNPVDQRILIYGRTVTQDDEKTYTVRNEPAILRRGEVALDVSSPWIQTEAAAKDLGTWITTHWSGGADEIEVESFGNPLLQIGDVVSINYPILNMGTSTHKYFIVGIEQSYSKGLTTTFKLRRAKI